MKTLDYLILRSALRAGAPGFPRAMVAQTLEQVESQLKASLESAERAEREIPRTRTQSSVSSFPRPWPGIS